jgi:hypothetical protein
MMSRFVLMITLALMVVSTGVDAGATWRPEYAKSPLAVQNWFRLAAPPDAAQRRLGIGRCCEQAERLMTRFVASAAGDWAYYPDPACTSRGCKLLPIPNDIVHRGRIKPIPGTLDGLDAAELRRTLKTFETMKREGVLFIWQGKPTCFWPPDRAGG